MINLVYLPQRADFKAEYIVRDDVLTIKIGDLQEVFDFTELEEGIAEEIITEYLTINPIVSVEKIGNEINITAIRFYGADEKELFENGYN